MAHNINVENGIASMAYNVQNEKPWHGLGQAVQGAMTAQEALEKSHLNFDVIKCPMNAVLEDPITHDKTMVNIEDKTAIIRADNKAHLGIVGNKYTVLQNRDAFSFFDAIVGKDEAMYETVGALGKGEKIWIMAKLPTDIVVKGNDVSNCYLLLYNSHDGSSAIRCRFTPIRVVCQNTLHLALKGSANEVCIRHTVNAEAKLQQAHQLLNVVKRNIDTASQLFNKLADIEVDREQVQNYLLELYPNSAIKNSRSENIRNEINKLFINGKGNRGKTAWDLYNGVIEYTDYYRNVNNTDEDNMQSRRWEVANFGSGLNLKELAFDKILEFAK